MKYKLCIINNRKEHVFKSNNRHELINKLLEINKLVGNKVKFTLLEKNFDYSFHDYRYNRIVANYNYYQ